MCGLVTDFRTFYNDYLMVVKFFEWLKENQVPTWEIDT